MQKLKFIRGIVRAARPIIILFLAEEFRIANIYLSSAVGFLGMLCAAQDFYLDYKKNKSGERNPQLKTKLLSHTIGFTANLFFSIAILVGSFISNFALGMITLGSGFVTLIKDFYVAHQGSKKLVSLRNKQVPQDEIDIQRDIVFKSKMEVLYSALLLAAGILFTAALAFPPLAIAGIVVLSIATAWETIDKCTEFKFSRWLTGYHQPKKIQPDKTPQIANNLIKQKDITPEENKNKVVRVYPSLFSHCRGTPKPQPIPQQRAFGLKC